MTTFVCLNWGNYCGRGLEYVQRLFDMVCAHACGGDLPAAAGHRFVCFTDNPDGLPEGMEAIPLPEGVFGWWNKLYLFKEGLFADGERVFFLDLDTIITGPLDDILQYDGEFATLRDFYHPERYGPGIILWRAGFGHDLWGSFERAGFPTDLPLGDLSWINQCFGEWNYTPDVLQEVFPGQFCSYKVHARQSVPDGVRVVCFHGLPRPHEAGGWVERYWGGKTEFTPLTVCNSSPHVVAANIKHACGLGLPTLNIQPGNDRDAVIVNGGPSVEGGIEQIRARQASGQFILATNGAHDYLIRHGITPDASLVIDARPGNAAFVAHPSEGTTYYLASQCDPACFTTQKNTVLLHLNTENALEMIPGGGEIHLVSGGSTVGLIAISLAHILGFRRFHLYGMDSSYRETEHHAYEQRLNAGERVMEVEAAGRTFRAAPWMIQQAQEFQELAAHLANEGCLITVAGDGLLPWIARHMQ